MIYHIIREIVEQVKTTHCSVYIQTAHMSMHTLSSHKQHRSPIYLQNLSHILQIVTVHQSLWAKYLLPQEADCKNYREFPEIRFKLQKPVRQTLIHYSFSVLSILNIIWNIFFHLLGVSTFRRSSCPIRISMSRMT